MLNGSKFGFSGLRLALSVKVGAAAAFGFLVAGCALIPSAGPTTSEVVSSAQEGGISRYILRDFDQGVVSILASARTETLVRSFGDQRPAPNQSIMVGDIVNVVIWEAAAGGLFSAPATDRSGSGARTALIPEQVVARDGAITVPYAGRIRIVGMTTPQVERLIVERLTGKAIEPQVLVTVPKSSGNTATVVGEVTNGARVPLSLRGDRILDVVAAAGGIKAPAHESFVTLQRRGRSVSVPMQRLIANPAENIFAHPGDTITVVRDPQTFSAFGATGRNAVVPFEAAGITLEQAIAKAGGLVDTRSDPHGVFLLRYEPVGLARQLDPQFPFLPSDVYLPVVYRLNLRDAGSYFLARGVTVRNRDMIYIANAPLTELQKVLQLFTTAAQPVSMGSAMATALPAGF
jgi:polysaccharide biosynthesis/export protein